MRLNKQTSTFCITFLGFLLLFTSCNKQDASPETTSIKKNSFENLTLAQLLRDDDFNISIKKFGIKDHIDEKIKSSSYKKESNFSIDTENIVRIEKENYTSYTFKVIIEFAEVGVLENLVIEKKGKSLRGFFIRYNYSQNFLNSLSKGIAIPFEGTIQRTRCNDNIENLLSSITLSKSATPANDKAKLGDYICVNTYISVPHKCASGKHGPEEKCNLSQPYWGYYTTQAVTNCWYGSNSGWSDEQTSVDWIAPDNLGGGDASTTPNNPSTESNLNMLVASISSRLGLFSEEEQWLVSLGEDPFVTELYLLLEENSSMEATQMGRELLQFYMEKDWKALLKQAISAGVTSTAEVAHRIYKQLSALAVKYPWSIRYLNRVVDEFREIALENTDLNPQTMGWDDLMSIWLFELGSFRTPEGFNDQTINFDEDDKTTLNVKLHQGVAMAKAIAINQIRSNILTRIDTSWSYGVNQYFDNLASGDLTSAFLGSYSIDIDIVQNPDGSFTLKFKAFNTSNWESASRFRIDYDGDGNHDGIFPPKARNQPNSINLGGNINQCWRWSEPFNNQ